MSKILINLITLYLTISYSSTTYSKTIREIGDLFNVAIPSYALGLAMSESDYTGTKQWTYSVLSSQITSELLKKATKRKRPDYEEGDKRDSFPSGHTAAAFSGATFIHKRYGLKQAIIPYTMAGFVGYSRVQAKRHHKTDVIAGALISSFYNWVFVDKADNNLSFITDGETTKLEYKTNF